MHFSERSNGAYVIYAGALETVTGEGFLAAVVVHRRLGERPSAVVEVHRNTELSHGHRWPSFQSALGHALAEGELALEVDTERLRSEAPRPVHAGRRAAAARV